MLVTLLIYQLWYFIGVFGYKALINETHGLVGERGGSYKPGLVQCPNNSLIRSANEISPGEKEYIRHRTMKSQKAVLKLIERHLGPIDMPFSQPINIALAISGGGYRSMLTAAGVLKAYDERVPNSSFKGFLQASNYIGGISGGSWLVLGNAVNDFKPMNELINEFDISNRLLEGVPDFDPGYKGIIDTQGAEEEGTPGSKRWFSGILNIFTTAKEKNPIVTLLQNLQKLNKKKKKTSQESSIQNVFEFYKSIHLEVNQKKTTGSYVSFTDYWGRALKRRIFLNARTNKFSSVMDLESMREHDQPFPIVTAIRKSAVNGRAIVEITPYEFGSWDKSINGFFQLKYIGSKANNGNVRENDCVHGYDDVGFLAATSSSLFNSVFVRMCDYLVDVKQETKSAIQTILLTFGLGYNYTQTGNPQKRSDYAIYSPNPFFNYSGAETSVKHSKDLYLADGGDGGQNIPFSPFLQPQRRVDLILAFDMSSDIYNFPNGSVLLKTAANFHNDPDSGFSILGTRFSVFPKVPEINQFSGLKNQPFFLGCDLLFDYPHFEDKKDDDISDGPFPPLIVYTANQPISFPSNTSTFKLSYTAAELNGMLQNGVNLATNKESDNFAACLICASIKRNFDTAKYKKRSSSLPQELPPICQSCFDNYCWHNISAAPLILSNNTSILSPGQDLTGIGHIRKSAQR